MNRHGYKVLLQNWFGTEPGLMIGSEGKIHGWGLESFEPTSYPQTGPGHFCWFSQQNFQDRALAQQLFSTEVSMAISGVACSGAEGWRRSPEGTPGCRGRPRGCGGESRLGELGKGAQPWGVSGPQMVIEHFLKEGC